MQFTNRVEAGQRLLELLAPFASDDVVVLGLPRGGVPVAEQVARGLHAPLDVILVRKLGVPIHPELAMGAIGEGDVCTINSDVVELARIRSEDLVAVERKERIELERRAQLIRSVRPRVDLTGRVALIVDDGLATGSTALAACEVARAQGAKHIIVAVPVAPVDAAARLMHDADEFVVVETPERFNAVGVHYQNFDPVSDQEVLEILGRQVPALQPGFSAPSPMLRNLLRDDEVTIRIGDVNLAGRLEIPESTIGIVIFAHGSGSSRLSPRNSFVANVLHQARIGTLLLDLLSPAEERDRSNVFDISLLARRLHAATNWVRSNPELADLPLGYFGASTGSAAALVAATFPSAAITAVVSRGGRPDLTNGRLGMVRAPTLLLVGGEDHVVLRLNREAKSHLTCESKLVVIPGATHLFEEPGTLQVVATEASKWFVEHMITAGPISRQAEASAR